MENALVKFKKELGEYCVICEFVELSIRSMKKDHPDALTSMETLLDFSKKHNIFLSDCNSAKLSLAVPQCYIFIVYRCFEIFLQSIYDLIREYEFDGLLFKRKQEESWLECIDRRLKDRVSIEVRNLYYICSYYHLIRNYAAHSLKDKVKTERLTAYKMIDQKKCSLKAMFNKLNAPNQEESIGFDDFVLFSRSSIRLAEEYWKGLEFNYELVINKLPKEIIKKCGSNPQRAITNKCYGEFVY